LSEKQKEREGEEEYVSSYWLTVREGEDART
jgi:hypothetical protein